MEKKKISQYALIKNGIDPKTLDSIKKGKGITVYTLGKICEILKCKPNDVIEFIGENY